MTTPVINDFTAEEIAAAYRRARLRYKGVSLLRALNDPLIYKALVLSAAAWRKNQQQHGQPAPILQAA